MNLQFSRSAWHDYLHWSGHDKTTLRRLNALIEDIRRTPFTGLGKPELLRGDLSEWWSRRITQEHRLVYRLRGRPNEDQAIEIVQCRYHY